jgi:undecaprenyl-diphosphatase
VGLMNWITDYLHQILDAVSGNLWLSVVFIFLVCIGEAVFIIGLAVPSLPILVLTGGLIA